MDRVYDAALRFLVLQLNRVQTCFEFEFVPYEANDPFLIMLSRGAIVDRQMVRYESGSFHDRQMSYLRNVAECFDTKEVPPSYLVVLTTAKFDDNHYSMRRHAVSVIALGNWRSSMAPPSILEFVLTLTIREAIASVSERLRGSVHLGTKGCVCDVTPLLGDARQKVLSSYLCTYCRDALVADGLSELIPQIQVMLDRSWLGVPDDHSSPAAVTSALGHDLFVVKGLQPTLLERIRVTLRQDGFKQLLATVQAVTAAVFIAALLVWFRLKG
jgi:hypothetical protein